MSNVYFENYSEYIQINWSTSSSHRNYEYTRLSDSRIKVSTVGISPIYPEETVSVIRFNFDVSIHHIRDVFEKLIDLGILQIQQKYLF